MTLPHEDLGDRWRAARPATVGIHLDSAACSRQSFRVLEAVSEHAVAEAVVGGYRSQDQADRILQQGRAALAALVGMAAADVAFAESAAAALSTLLTAWRLPAGSRVGVLPGEYYGNRAAFEYAGLTQVSVDPDAPDVRGLEFMHVTVVPSHRGVVQPIDPIAEACRHAGVPLVLDAAQALGVVDLTDCGADAVYGTSRKWLAGPRGVGFLLMGPDFPQRLTPLWPGTSGARAFEPAEAHVAGRVGLAHAIGDHLAAGPDRVRERLAAIGRATRERFAESAWTVWESLDSPTSVTTLGGPDVYEAFARLTVRGFVLTLVEPERAPDQMTGPVIRVSPHLDVTLEQLDELAAAVN